MSKIKDLYAEVNEVEDLIPPRGLSNDTLIKLCTRKVRRNEEEWHKKIEDDVEFEEDIEDKNRFKAKNYRSLCDDYAEDIIDGVIEEEHIDVTDENWVEVRDEVSKYIKLYYGAFVEVLEDDYLEKLNRMCKENLNEWN